jgi:ribosomal protein S18 acetylase RimI-like enzyme
MPSWAKIIELPARAWRKTLEVGPLYALQLIYWQVVPHWLFDLNVWIVTTTDIRHRIGNAKHNPAIRWANESDIDALTRCGIERATITAAFERGVKIAVFERGGRIVAHARYGTATHEQDDWLLFKVGPHDVYGAGIWVSPDHRGRGIAPQVIPFVWSHFVRAGRGRSLGIINGLNRNSRRACAKAGVTEMGRIFYLRLLGLAYLHHGSLNRIGFWHPRNRLEILLAR